MKKQLLSLIAAGLMLGGTSSWAMQEVDTYKKNKKLLEQTITIDDVDYKTQQHPEYTWDAAKKELHFSTNYQQTLPVPVTIAPKYHPHLITTITITCPSALIAPPEKHGICWSCNPTPNYDEKVHALLMAAVKQVHNAAQEKVREREELGDTGMSFWCN
jgi:hypothetical protein